ncbi:MAG: HEAT repeat domain-containing protein, partial [Syntrophomonadaceae bacterium]|nr:HEAT repeat domain-containing protein [Syntrophomonadaceae bacterium]
MLNSELEADRCAGIEMLAAEGHPGSIELLAGRLSIEQSPYVRRRIIHALGGTRCSFAAAVAVRLLSSPEAYVRNAALEILRELGEAALPAVKKIVNHPSRNLRKLAADALAGIPGDAAFSLLVAGLRDDDPNVVSACAEALGSRRDPRAVPALVEVLKQSVDLWSAFGVIESLVNLDDAGAMDVIDEFVSRPKWDGRERVILAGIWAFAVS